MSVRRLDPQQPADFIFTPDNEAWAQATIGNYPEGKQASAVIALLWRAQEQSGGWLPEPALRYVADKLDMAYIRVLEVATFYTMFQLSPVGKKAHIQVCGTTPCMLRGSGALIEACKQRVHASPHKMSPDGNFSWEEVECLGACVNAPLIQVGNKLYEDLTPDTLGDVLDAFARGETPEAGPRVERDYAAPIGGATTLSTPGLYEELARKFAGSAHSEQSAAANDAGVSTNLAEAAGTAAATGSSRSTDAGPAAKGLGAGVKVTAATASGGAAGNENKDRGQASRATLSARTPTGESAGKSVQKSTSGTAHDGNSDEGSKNTEGNTDKSKAGKGKIGQDVSDSLAAAASSAAVSLASSGAAARADKSGDSAKPAGLPGARGGKADDLKRISGIGPKLEGVLNGLGIFHFDQIAQWPRDTVVWVDDFLSFKGRIDRDEWIKQAGQLAGGGETSFSKRVDKGEVDSSKSD